jgi:hypothetical protein
MKTIFGFAAVVLCLFTAGAARAQEASVAQDAPVDSLALARQYTVWLYEAQVDSLLAHSTDEFRERHAQEPSFTIMSGVIAERAGIEISVVEETWKLRNGECQYWRTAEFSNMREPLLIRWVLDPKGRIDGIGGGPLSQAPPVESETCEPR